MKICPQCKKLHGEWQDLCKIDGTPLINFRSETTPNPQPIKGEVKVTRSYPGTTPIHQPIKVKVEIARPQTTNQSLVSEYRRKCRACTTIWHSLVSREVQLEKQKQSGECDQVMMCGSAEMQAKRNIQATHDEMTRLRQCPKCGSSNFNEEIVTY